MTAQAWEWVLFGFCCLTVIELLLVAGYVKWVYEDVREIWKEMTHIVDRFER